VHATANALFSATKENLSWKGLTTVDIYPFQVASSIDEIKEAH
jgi:hypothetical protein